MTDPSIWNPGTGASTVNANNTLVTQNFIVTDATVLTYVLTNFTYVPNTGSLRIYINGFRQVPQEDFIESSSTSFTLVDTTHKLEVGDEICVEGFVGITANLLDTSPLSTNLASPTGAALVSNKRTITGAVTTDLRTWMDRQIVNTWSDLGITADGVTDKTAALVTVLTNLGIAGWRGTIYIPYNTKFTVLTVYAAVPVGVTIIDESGINIGHSPGGIQRFRMTYSGDIASDDFSEVIASGHHAVKTFINTGDRGTASAIGRFMSEQFAIGINKDNDLMTTLLRQHKKDPGGNKWMMSYRLQTPYSVAIANPQNWVTAHVYAAGSYCVSDSGKVYVTTAGGVSGVTAPTGTGTGINDGGVLWNYAFPALTLDLTYKEEDEQGNVRQFGVPSLSTTMYHYWDYAGVDRFTITIDGTAHTTTLTDLRRGFNFLKLADTTGVQLDGMRSFNWQTISGATPALSNSYALVNNGGATSMTNMTLPGLQTQAYVCLMFPNANTTIPHGTNFLLKGSVAANPPTASFMEFIKNTAVSSAWIEKSRSF